MATNRPRVLLLSPIDPTGRRGQVVEICACHALGVDVAPVPTGALLPSTNGRYEIIPTSPSLFRGMLNTALDGPLSGMLVGPLASGRIASILADALTRNLPETMVLAPWPLNFDVVGKPGWWMMRTLRRKLVREATVVVITSNASPELVVSSENSSLGPALINAGAHAAWLVDRDSGVRARDHIYQGTDISVLDYPSPKASVGTDALPAALAALLARGFSLTEAVEGTQRWCGSNDGLPHALAV